MKRRNRMWLIRLSIVEVGLATIIMIIGMKSLSVFVMAMAAHSAYIGTGGFK